MTTTAAPPTAMKALKTLVALAFLATAVAALALLWFLVADPAEGTTLYDALGILAAASGLAAGALFIGAAVWAQIAGLWSYAPTWIRVVAATLVIAAAVYGIVKGVLR